MTTKVLESLAQKLNPNRYTDMSPQMAAIVGYVVDEKYTEPEIISLSITSDGFVMSRDNCPGGMDGGGGFIGSVSDLERNVDNLLAVAGLTEEELSLWHKLYTRKVEDWRR